MSQAPTERPPFPPFSREDAIAKVRKAEDAWNGKDPVKVSFAYTEDSTWRNRNEFISGRDEIVSFLERKWAKELDYKLVKELWAFTENRIAVRFAYEWYYVKEDGEKQWVRSYGNENWEFDPKGFMQARHASINDLEIDEADRKFLWEGAVRPDDFPELSEMGL